MKKYVFPSLVGLIAFDQLTKYAAVRYLSEPVVLINYWAELRLAYNEGVAFSLPVPFIAVMILALGVVAYLAHRIKTKDLHRMEIVTYTLVMAGALGNVIDRIVNNGKVIDFIAIGSWPVFNVADSCITIGVLLYLWWEITSPSRS